MAAYAAVVIDLGKSVLPFRTTLDPLARVAFRPTENQIPPVTCDCEFLDEMRAGDLRRYSWNIPFSVDYSRLHLGIGSNSLPNFVCVSKPICLTFGPRLRRRAAPGWYVTLPLRYPILTLYRGRTGARRYL